VSCPGRDELVQAFRGSWGKGEFEIWRRLVSQGCIDVIKTLRSTGRKYLQLVFSFFLKCNWKVINRKRLFGIESSPGSAYPARAQGSLPQSLPHGDAPSSNDDKKRR